MSGHTTPQMIVASDQPTADTAANAKGSCSARRHPASLSRPSPSRSCSGADHRTLMR